MAYVGLGNYVVVVLHVGGSKASYIKLVLKRERCSGKTWFPAGSCLPKEEHVDGAFRELFAENGLILTVDYLTRLSNNHVRVPLFTRKH
jgi:hypothetical protein